MCPYFEKPPKWNFYITDIPYKQWSFTLYLGLFWGAGVDFFVGGKGHALRKLNTLSEFKIEMEL